MADRFRGFLPVVVDVAIDYVSSRSVLETAAKSLARRGRLVILGGAATDFTVSGFSLLYEEQSVLGSRYVARHELMETLDLVARGEIWPLVSDIRPWTDAEAVHERVEAGAVAGRAALLIG